MKLRPVYYCNQCKKITDDLESLYFVEEDSPRGFCGEACIEEYFTPLIDFYESEEKSLRDSYDLGEESCLSYVGDPKYMEGVITRPKEIWVSENSLDESIYTYISEFIDDNSNTFYMILLCSVYNYKPSFIFMVTTTADKKYLEEFKIGTQITDVKKFLENTETTSHGLSYDEEFINDLEQLKSSILADLMEIKKETDISLEEYPLYDDFLKTTLESSDEIYVNSEYDDEISVYIKACELKGVSFFYIALCKALVNDDGEDILIPILSFPSIDGDIPKFFKKGKIISGNLLN